MTEVIELRLSADGARLLGRLAALGLSVAYPEHGLEPADWTMIYVACQELYPHLLEVSGVLEKMHGRLAVIP